MAGVPGTGSNLNGSDKGISGKGVAVKKVVTTLLAGVLVLAGIAGSAEAKKKPRPLVTFEAEGSTTLSNPTDLMGHGITRTEFENSCAVPTITQGVDGFVIELPRKVSAVTTRVSVNGASASGVGLMDLFFFSDLCGDMGEILGSDDFDPLMPAGTKFVLVTNWLGDPTEFTFTATEVR